MKRTFNRNWQGRLFFYDHVSDTYIYWTDL